MAQGLPKLEGVYSNERQLPRHGLSADINPLFAACFFAWQGACHACHSQNLRRQHLVGAERVLLLGEFH